MDFPPFEIVYLKSAESPVHAEPKQSNKEKEFYVALCLLKIFNKQTDMLFQTIQLVVTSDFFNSLKGNKKIKADLTEIVALLKRVVKEDTAVDFMIGEGTPEEKGKRLQFQVKHCPLSGANINISDTFVDFVKKIAKQYGEIINCSLVIIVFGGLINFDFIYKKLREELDKFPFYNICIFSQTNEHIVFGEIWPTGNIAGFSPKDLFEDGKL